jgi:hypothetical protein
MQISPRQTSHPSGAYVGGAVLIVIGLLALVSNLSGINDIGEAIPLGIGLAFIAAYAMTRHYGFLVPGGILTGIGSGILAAFVVGVTDNGTYVVLGGGLGFLLIYAVDLLVTQVTLRWWPVIPGAAMLVIAGGMATQNQGLIRDMGLWSPLVLVVIGVWILVARSRAAKG